MTRSLHTPGPWAVEPLQWDYGGSIAIVATRGIIATISPENEEDNPNESTAIRGPNDEANALLIAEAPNLLDAILDIKRIAGKAGDYYNDDETLLFLIADRVQQALRFINGRSAS